MKIEKQKEIRKVDIGSIETRLVGDSEEKIISGYINKYDEKSQFMGFFEVIKKGAFDKSLAEKDYIPALYNHNPDKVLGSTRSGTLRLNSDDIGLKFELKVNEEITYVRDLYELVKSGDVEGCSFGFYVEDDDWTTNDEGIDIRTINELNLIEVTITPFPAYKSSEANIRSYENYKNSKAKVKENKKLKRKLELELELLNL